MDEQTKVYIGFAVALLLAYYLWHQSTNKSATGGTTAQGFVSGRELPAFVTKGRMQVPLPTEEDPDTVLAEIHVPRPTEAESVRRQQKMHVAPLINLHDFELE